MHPAIAQKRPDIERLCRRYHVRRLEVFGSAARAADFDEGRSDADFLVEYAADAERGLEPYFRLKAELETLLARHVDLVEVGALRNPYVLADIRRSKELVYAA